MRTLQTDTEDRAELPAGGLRPLRRHAVRRIRAETTKWISDGRPRLASSQTKTTRAVSIPADGGSLMDETPCC